MNAHLRIDPVVANRERLFFRLEFYLNESLGVYAHAKDTEKGTIFTLRDGRVYNVWEDPSLKVSKVDTRPVAEITENAVAVV